jgi:hypothetical protein
MTGHYLTKPKRMDAHRVSFLLFDEEKQTAISCQTAFGMDAASKLHELEKLKRITIEGSWIPAHRADPMVFCVESIIPLERI